MAYLIGTDEAGYGPNLGPLVVAATLWEVPDDGVDVDLYDSLGAYVTSDDPAKAGRPTPAVDGEAWWIADSKRIYAPGKGLDDLEKHTLAGLRVSGCNATTWQSIWSSLDEDAPQQLNTLPWYASFDRPLPMVADLTEVAGLSEAIQLALTDTQVQLHQIKACAIFPPDFNGRVRNLGNKATVLSHVTLELVRRLLEPLEHQPILIHCDKHGGRNKYAGLLQHFFPEELVRVGEEGRWQSTYAWGTKQRSVSIRFVAKGEHFLPSALASMTAKLLREFAMSAFNDFWRSHVEHLRPTAGYPVDAKRFKQAIAPTQLKLGIPDDLLWRMR